MKKLSITILSIILLFSFNSSVSALSAYLSTSKSNVYVGDTFTVSANIRGAAAWSLLIDTTGPVSGCRLNDYERVNDSGNNTNINKTLNATCKATGTGTITIRLTGDITKAGNISNGEDDTCIDISDTKTVFATKPEPSNNTNTTTNNNPVINNPTTSNNNKTNVGKSNNNKLKDISVENQKIVKKDDNNYTLTVSNNISSIMVKATPEDNKAKVSGTGKHNLKIGENLIKVVVTSESGLSNTTIIKVTRKDAYYIEDLYSCLEENDSNIINIKINQDTIIKKEDLDRIKSSKQTVRFNYQNDSISYFWIIDGSKLSDTNDFITTVTESENKKSMLEASNYSDGLFFGLKQTDYFPQGIILKIYVGNKYVNNDLVNVYAYSKKNNKLELVSKLVKVVDRYVEFEVVNSSDYLVTKAKLNNTKDVTKEKSSSIASIIVTGAIVVLIIAIIIIFVLKMKNYKSSEIPNAEDNSSD